MSKTITIIGAGPGGLASAILLASAGQKVRILERMDTVGGRTSAIEGEGYRFDLGPTFFLYPRVLEEIFRNAGTRLEDEVEMVRLDPQYRIEFGAGGQIDCTADIEEMERQIAAICPQDAPGFRKFLAENRRKLQLMEPCLETSFDGWRSVLNPRLFKLLPMLKPHQSVDTYLKKFFSDPRVRLAFCFQSKYLGMSPFRCPSLFSILSFLEYEHGVWHPIGGCSAATEAMARVAKQLGVEIILNADVEEINFNGRRATGVRTATETFPSDAVVINADFAHAMRRMIPDHLRKRWPDKVLAKKKYSCSTFMLYLGVEGRYENQPHHKIHISAEYEKNLDEIENQHVLSDDPSFYVQNACVTDPGLAPAGHSTLYILAPVSHQHPNIDWKQEAPAFRKKLLEKVAQAGYPDLESKIRFEKMITPADWEDSRIYQGATFNLAHTLDQMLHLRPRNRFEEFDGVYLVGGGTHPGSGLPVIFEGARISSVHLLNDLGVDASGIRPPRGDIETTPIQPVEKPDLFAASDVAS